jgi:hypothetical protein
MGTDMAEEKKPVVKAPEPPKLGRAAESGDAGIQNLLALQAIHGANGDTDKVNEIHQQLAELGYTAQ